MLDIATVPTERPTPATERSAILENPGFGRYFTDHMVTIDWQEGEGWHNGQLRAREPFVLDPASSVFHYGQEIFEGLKAYKNEAGEIIFFRPEENARRFVRSAERLAMPGLPEEVFLNALRRLVETDGSWVPDAPGSLYLRPFQFAADPFLGVRPASRYRFCVIASPVAAYFKGGSEAIKVWVSEDYSRAARGGTGHAKCGGNYAASLIAQAEGTANGCDQVVFLDAAETRWVEEMGGMNVFFVMDDGSLLTPSLGTVLPGITRDSIIVLAREMGHEVREGRYGFSDWIVDAQSGRLRECFACGTAATIVPIGEVRHRNGAFTIAHGGIGPITRSLKAKLSGIQHGSITDDHGWVRKLSAL